MEKTHTQGETWQEALKRLDNFTKNESSLIHLDSDVDHEEISEFEKRLTISLPEDLKQFYTQYKSLYVYIDEKIFFAIFPLSELSTNSYITKNTRIFYRSCSDDFYVWRRRRRRLFKDRSQP